LLPIPHHKQQQQADCLAACAAMVLAHHNIAVDYAQLLKILKVKSFGAAGQNLKYLASLGVEVIYREGSLEELREYLLAGLPCIVLLNTADLPHWSYSTNHAVVVVGFDDSAIFLNDPAFDQHPISIPAIAFELAWMMFDYRLGVIRN
jgi:ABC-type bacteriocin/lantibiotic exporter with double-glycine peptidase domain